MSFGCLVVSSCIIYQVTGRKMVIRMMEAYYLVLYGFANT